MRLVYRFLCVLFISSPLVGSSLPAQLIPTRSDVTLGVPDAPCHRSDKAWASQPISIAVLDFGYPGQLVTPRSGVVLADMVYGRLSQDRSFSVSRADWVRMGYDDNARVAALGRQLGVDAVLAGAWEYQNGPAPAVKKTMLFRPEVRQDPLRMAAGLVDACTGELILKMSSDGSGSSLTQDAALNPGSFASDLDGAINSLVSPLEHFGSLSARNSGTVKMTDQAGVTVQLTEGSPVKVGDQLSVRANRIGKDLANYSLHNITNQEIGKVTVQQVAGNTASGIFSGVYSPMTGDVVEASQRR